MPLHPPYTCRTLTLTLTLTLTKVEYADRLPQLHRHFMPGQLHVPDFVVFLDDVDDRPPP